jgi:hypothetical protein
MLPAALGYGVYSASNGNEYQKQKKNVSGGGGVKRRPAGKADNLTAICERTV